MAYDVKLDARLGKLGAVSLRQDFPLPPAPINRALAAQRIRPDSSGGFAPPVMDEGMLWKDVGSSGLRQFSGWVREEFLPQLAGREAARAYREMSDNSPIVGSIVYAINAAARKIKWRLETPDDSPEAANQAEFFEGCMDDMSHTWNDFVTESLSMLIYGFAPHETVYKRSLGKSPGRDPKTGEELPRSNFKDGMIRWRRLPLRGQDTVLKWFFGDSGQIRGMTQQPWTGPLLSMPIEKLLLFRPQSHKGNPEGRSILRTAYRPWYFAKRMEELEAILFERMGGIPTIYVPKELMDLSASGDVNATLQLATYKRIATNIRVDEQMGLVLPSDVWQSATGSGAVGQYRFELVTPQGGRGQAVDSNVAITRYNVNIMTSVMADFLTMGHDTRGAQNLGETKMDMFMQAVEGFLNANGDVLTRHGAERLCALNGMNPEKMPKFVPDMPQRVDLDVLSNFILRLSQSGMPLFPNETLEQYIADAGGLPDIMEDGARDLIVEQQQQQDQIALDAAQAGADATRSLADNPQQQQPPPKPMTKLEKALAAGMAKRIKYFGGSAHTPKRRRGYTNGHAA